MVSNSDFKKITRLVKKAAQVEAKLSNTQKVLLARKKLQKLAGIDDPQAYGVANTKDVTDISATVMEDKNIKKIIKDLDDDERHVFEGKVRKAVRKLVANFEESKHDRDTSGKFTSGGGDSGNGSDSDEKDSEEKVGPTPDDADDADSTEFEDVSKNQLKALNKLDLDGKIENIESGMVPGRGKLITTDSGAEYAVYLSEQDARSAAKESLENLFDDIGIEGWSEGFREQFITVTETDAALIAQDDAESQRDVIQEELEEEGDLKGDALDEEVENRLGDIANEVEGKINDDARGYFVEETGQMSDEDFNKADFVMIDEDALFEASIDEDGIAHTLAGFDGEEIESDDGQLLYRTN